MLTASNSPRRQSVAESSSKLTTVIEDRLKLAESFGVDTAPIRAALKAELDALEDIASQLNGFEGRGYRWIRERAQKAIAIAKAEQEAAHV